MELKGKLKEGFFEWLNKTYNNIYCKDYKHGEDMNEWFYLPQSAQFGLIQEYADTLGIPIETQFRFDCYYVWIAKDSDALEYGTRPEAQVAALKSLNEIVNQLEDK